MSIVKSMKDVLRRFFGLKKTVNVGTVLKDKEISQLDKIVELERGYKEGIIAAQEEEIKQLQKGFAPKDIDYAEYLSKQKKAMYARQFENALSMRKLFLSMNTKLGEKKEIIVTSFNAKRNFGSFEDIFIRNDGRFAIITNYKGRKMPIMVARTVKDIFTNYGGLTNTIGMGIMQLNLDENRNYVENILEKDVPEVVVDGNGQIHVAEINSEKYIKQLIEKESLINELQGMLSSYEKELHKLTSNKNFLKLVSKFNESRASTAEADIVKLVQSVDEVNKNFKNITSELALKGYATFISEKKVEQLEDLRDKIIGTLNDKLGKEDIQVARELINDIANDVIDITQGAKVNVVVPQQPQQRPQQTSGAATLTEKFKEMV